MRADNPASQAAFAKASEYLERKPLVGSKRSLSWITDHVCRIVEQPAPLWWWIATVLTGAVAALTPAMLTYLVATGVGVWGLNAPVAWAWDITNFVFWIGIGHAGTLISAILFLTRQKWRTSINRSAEAMTIFAVICAGIFPAFHVGRVWFAWWLFPIPNANAIWQNFRSPLLWDVFAVSTYFTVSLIFWYLGLIPDLASLRDRAKTRLRQMIYGILALGWRGSNRQWTHYEKAYLILAGISTPLVLSVHSVVSFDFATSIIPGWHTTIFPPYFVAGAVYAGFAMVLTIGIPVRKFYNLEDFITLRHIRNMCKVMLATGLIVGYGYLMELFFAWYSGNTYEQFMMKNRMFGPYGYMYWLLILCNILVPQLLWVKKFRENLLVIFIVSMFINVGMWLERFVIIVMSLHRDFLPSSWRMYSPTVFDFSMFFGTIGLFLTLMFLFLRFVPIIPMFEMKVMLPQAKVEEDEKAAEKEKGTLGGAVPQFGD